MPCAAIKLPWLQCYAGAGKRAGGAGSPAKGGAAGQKQHSGKSNTQQGRPNIYENVPSTEVGVQEAFLHRVLT